MWVQVLGGVLASEPSLAKWAHRPTGRCRCRKPEIPVRFRVGPLWQHSPVVQRQRRLVHIQETMVQLHPGLLDHAQIRQPAERLGSDPRVCRFDSCSGYLKKYVLVEQRSARLPVTQETVGSNPIGDAEHGTVRQSGRATDFKRPWLWVRLPPVLLQQHASVGHWQAQVAVTHPLSSFAGSTPARRTVTVM